MPGEEEEFKRFIKILSYGDNDKILLNSTKDAFAKEIEVLKNTGENLAEKIKDTAEKIITPGKDKNIIVTAPIQTIDGIENRLMNTETDGAGTVMRPKTPVVEKKSSFFKKLKYDVSLSDISIRRQLKPDLNLYSNIDFFDKITTQNIEKSGPYTKFSAGVGYAPFNNMVKIDLQYNMPRRFLRSRIYLRKGNPGINAEYAEKLSKDETLNFKGSVFKSDAAFEFEYRKKLDEIRNISIGTYGSTKYKETGVYGRIGF